MLFKEDNAISLNKYNRSCIYFLLKNGAVVYVGKSKNGFRRVSQHCVNINDDNVKIIKCKEKQLIELEDYYMIKYQPMYNTLINSNRKNLPGLYNKIRTKIKISIIEFSDLIKNENIETKFFKNSETILKKDYNYLYDILIKRNK